jgi:hypothetical protein
MGRLIAKLLGTIRYRRRWRILAAADKAATKLDHHVRNRGRRHGVDQRLRPSGCPRLTCHSQRVSEDGRLCWDGGSVHAGLVLLREAAR